MSFDGLSEENRKRARDAAEVIGSAHSFIVAYKLADCFQSAKAENAYRIEMAISQAIEELEKVVGASTKLLEQQLKEKDEEIEKLKAEVENRGKVNATLRDILQKKKDETVSGQA